MTDERLPTRDDPDNDPRLWLEEVDGAEALAWVEARSAATMSAFGDAAFAADRDALLAILDRPDRIPYPRRRDGLLFNYWKDADHPRGVWRRTTLESFRTAAPEWEILLDLDALAETEGEDWIWAGPSTAPGQSRVLISLSRGGGDAAVTREYDIATKDFVAGGFELPEAKGGAEWLDEDTLLLSSSFGEGMATKSGYPRTARLWRRGEAVEAAPVLFESDEASMAVFAGLDRTQPGETLMFSNQISFFEAAHHVGDRSGPTGRLDLPTDASPSIYGDWVAATRRTDWTIDGRTYAAGALLACSRRALLDGAPSYTPLFEPEPRRVLDRCFWVRGKLVVSILDELKPVFEIWTPDAAGWRRARLDGVPDAGVAEIGRLDEEAATSDGALMAQYQDPATPPTLLLIGPNAIAEREEGGDRVALATPEILKRAPSVFRADGLATTRHEAIAADGVAVPYTVTGPEGASGDAPVYLTAYGGFEFPLLPRYDGAIGKLWLERGGVSVIGHIRGGGEFGPNWHEAGRRAGKRVSHDDFAAVAADLVARGVTVPGRIAAEGGSNGGLLIANMLTRWPERFGALFCTVPLVDMRRYTKLLAGPSWVDEYGDPDMVEDWAFLKEMSAYHAAEPGRAYPPILIATTRRDDRVHPGHARKFAAKLQALGYDAHYYEPAAGGHSYGKDNKERAAFAALGLRFLRAKIGWSAE